MKIFIALMILSIAPSVFAEGAWSLNCVSSSGISLNSSNGLSEITLNHTSKEKIQIENYDLGLTDSHTKAKWIGSPVILSESSENSCNSDQATTIFKQKVKIIKAGKVLKTVEMVCTDSVTTSSGAEADECSDEQF